MLGPVLIATKGNGAPEVGAAYTRALQLGRQSGEDARLFRCCLDYDPFISYGQSCSRHLSWHGNS